MDAPPKSLASIQMCLRRMGLDKEARQEKREELRAEESQDIENYQQVKDYIANAEGGNVTQKQIKKQLKYLRQLWELMDKTNPNDWTYEQVTKKIETIVPKEVDERGRVSWTKKGTVKNLLSPLSTMWQGKLPKNWSSGLQRDAGELKDHLTFEEFKEFINELRDTPEMSVEGWRALFELQVNLGCREGVNGKTGILSLKWQDINFELMRCSLHEKGGRGKAGRIWRNLPLDLFDWIHGFEDLLIWHRQQNEPTKGKVFPVTYNEYSKMFHETRKRGNGRIAQKSETLRPHIFRKTHAQWLVKMWVPLDMICGVFPDGFFGVGWDNPEIPMKYYITPEERLREKAIQQFKEREEELGLND